ncbi:glucose 1-dehydrogenase [candidate division KSB1 bacterium]|nr:glucose 1-dehydrogenase [candidate division KSB1 bacterium]
MENMGLTDKIVIVTGASSGIGKAAARLFYREGARLCLVSRSADALIAVRKELGDDDERIHIIAKDVTHADSADFICEGTIARFGWIDVLVNAAGIIATGSLETTDIKDFDYMMNINLRSVFLLIQKALPSLIERKGNVVNVSSVTGLRSFPDVLSYCVSKAALDQLTRCAALELAAKGVRINAVNPGVTITELHKRGGMDEKKYDAFLQHSKSTHPLGRVGDPTEIAELILFLASPHAGWITGATYSIDGGRSLTCAR